MLLCWISHAQMRRHLIVSIIFCFLVFIYIGISLQIKSTRKYSLQDESIHNWTLSKRNTHRLKILFAKYGLLLNLTKLKTNSNTTKTMIYSCQSFCGGWGDRLRGILSAYVLALVTDRHFMIDMNYPCQITKVIEPNFVNWTMIHSKQPNRTRLNINTMRSYQLTYRGYITRLIHFENFTQIWSAYDDIYLSTNLDYMRLVFHNKHMSKKIQELFGRLPVSQLTIEKSFAFFFELLFKPSIAVEQRVNSILYSSIHRELICFHIRIGKNPTNPFDAVFTSRVNMTRAMIDFTDRYLQTRNSSLVFVTSDSGQAISQVLNHYSNSSMTIVGPILHIDRFNRRSSAVCDGFVKVLADFYLLGECQTSLISKSGFSMSANRRRIHANENLYTFNEKVRQIRKV